MRQRLTGRIVVYDLEFTAWEGSRARRWSGPGEHREVVQVGAVALDADDGFRETDSLELLVKPRINPMLSDYFVALTGISTAEVHSRGIDFADALDRFAAFAGEGDVPLLSFGPDYAVLRENCRLIDHPYPFAASQEMDVTTLIGRAGDLDLKGVASSDLPHVMGFVSPGPKHQALFDARSVAEALRVLRRRDLV